MLHFQAIHPRGIGNFYVEIIKVIIDPINNPNPKRMRISIGTKIHSVDHQVLNNLLVTIRF